MAGSAHEVGKPEAGKRDLAAQPVMSPGRVEELLRLDYLPTPEQTRRMQRIRRARIRREAAERDSRKAEQRSLTAMEQALGLQPNAPLPAQKLDHDEELTLLRAIEEVGETDKSSLREIFIGSLQDQEVFKSEYAKWRKQYDRDPKISNSYSFEEFARIRGQEFIRKQRKAIARFRSAEFIKRKNDLKPEQGSSKTQDKNTEAQDKQIDTLVKVIDLFIQANRVKMVEYSSLSQAQRRALFRRFSSTLEAKGFVNTKTKPLLKQLFEDLVGDIEYEVLQTQDYDATVEEMIAMVDLGLTDEEWDKRRELARDRNAKGNLQEYLQQKKQPVYAYISPTNETVISFSTIRDVAHASGVNLRPVEGFGDNVYYLDFPLIKDPDFRPKIRVNFPPGSTDINEADFIIEEPWPETDSKKGKPIDIYQTKIFKSTDVPRAINTLLLSYAVNKGGRVSTHKITVGNLNDVMTDQKKNFIAQRLLGLSIGERPLLEEQYNEFRRLMRVVLRDDGKMSLQRRLDEKLEPVMRNDGLLQYFRQALRAPGAVTKSLDEIIEEAELLQKGELK